MLRSSVQAALNGGALVSREDFRPFPSVCSREAWERVDKEARAYVAGAAQRYLHREYAVLPAAMYMEFLRSGDRREYEARYFERRTALYTLTLNECLTNDGAGLTTIINLIWAICEETGWVVPAHNNQDSRSSHPAPIALQDAEEALPYVDLFSAETASVLAWTLYFLRERLDAVSPMIARRAEYEIDRRVFTPYLQRDDMHWMGFSNGDPVNNWNPWINSNVLAAALLLERDEDRRRALLLRVAESADRFLSFYAPDGGCDEGPAYFGVAGASILDILELFHAATNGRANIDGEPLIRNMARYIMYAHISGEYFTNFADAAARVSPDAALLLRAAERMGLDDLGAFARRAVREGFAQIPYAVGYDLTFRRLRNLFTFRRDYGAEDASQPLSHAFPGIQVAAARERADGSGLYFAAKGGTNGESHNHNDIGNYIVYLDGEPAICDAGVETYRRQTFGAERYSIWTMQSRYHNTAIIGGRDQKNGRNFAARDFSFDDDGETAVFRADMAGAYDESARVKTYMREIALLRGKGEISVTDEFSLAENGVPVALPLLLASEPTVTPGEIRLPAGKRTLRVRFDKALFAVSVERVPIEDARLQNSWRRPYLYRALLARRDAPVSGSHTLTISV